MISLGFGQNKDLPTLVDEFGQANSEELTARMEQFRYQLLQNPAAKGYIIIYRDKDLPFGFPIRYETTLQNFLIKWLSLPLERFEIINGGLLNERKTQLWLSSSGNKSPIVDSIKEEFESDKFFLFDRFNYPTQYDGAGCCIIDAFTVEAKKASIDEFAEQLKKQTTAQAYLIFYGQYCDDCSASARYSRSGKYLGTEPNIYLDSSKTIARILRKEKNYLNKNYGIDNSKIITINGGYRKWQAIELWIVPKGGKVPMPKPESFPKKRLRKKK